MSEPCEFCGEQIHELARTRNHVWISCRHCQRSWREDLDPATSAAAESEPSTPAKASFQESTAGRYLNATVAVALAFAVRLALKPVIGNASPFLLFTPAVMLAAWCGGGGPAIWATGLSAVLGNQFFLRPISESGLEQWDRVAMFLLVGGLITSLTTVLRGSRRRLAESLWFEQKARAEAEAANQAKDDFVSLISHELQTPVSIVQGWATAIRKRQLDGEALGVALDAIERNAQVQSRLVQDILDRSQIVSGRLRLEPQVVSISEIVRAAVEQMRPTFDGNHVKLTSAIHGTRYLMNADPVRLQQVFTNLLSNAARCTPPGGHVVVKAICRAATAVVTISDDGVGIAPESLPHVFDGLRHDASISASPSKSLGLGLSIARHIVERHSGTIRVASDGPGKGATFTVELPLQQQHLVIDDHQARHTALGALRAISVLLVEDDADARMLLTQTLEHYGAHVWAVASASEAQGFLDRYRADVLLADLRMPIEDGFTLIHNLRTCRDPEVASIPAASITVSRLSTDRDRALAAGYQLHLNKPIDPDDLVSAMVTLVSMPRMVPGPTDQAAADIRVERT
jgi:signal transduction histidine kinase/ActR/RegA family two-component response regulator